MVDSYQSADKEHCELDYDNFEERQGFLKKVYGIVSAQMTVTAAFITFVQLKDVDEKQAFLANSAFWLVPAFVVSIFIEIAILCCRNVARRVPVNYIMLLVFTLAFSFLVAAVTVPYSPDIVIQAGGATALTTIALTVYALTTKTDMTLFGGALYIFSVAFLMIILTFSLFSPASLYSPFLCALAVVLYGFFLIYDTQLVAGKGHHKLSVDDYIIGALIIYLDIIMLFLELLKLFGRK